jgi:IS5 family transposase
MAPVEEIFCFIDDFCKHFEQQMTKNLLPNSKRKRKRRCSHSISEIMTILVMFHLSHYRTFKDFYQNCLKVRYSREFPGIVSYTRMLELIPLAFMPLIVMINAIPGKKLGQYYIDSTKLQVCDNLRIRNHKVFAGCAKRGKTSTGWFFGFKLHLVINRHGELMSFDLTTGEVDDRIVVEKMTEGLQGWLFGDKGYLGIKLVETLRRKGLELITKVRRNMKEIVLTSAQKYLLSKRGVVESVIDQLKALLHIQHTRHRSILNFQVNILAGLLAYIFKPKKPSVHFHQLNHQTTSLTIL